MEWIVAVIVTVIVIVLTILYYKCKKDSNIYKYITEEGPRFRVIKPIDPKKDYTVDEAIKLADEMKGVTILHARTNKGKVYRSSLTRHAEIVFIENKPNPEDITGLWITNSPCSDCAQRLITHFKSCHTKPDIFIGKIYQQEKEKNDEGLLDLMKEGFNIEVWESFQQDPKIVREIKNHLIGLGQKM